ncbi:diacylglycerol kinase theta-like [Dysidea avara]|uniref:diacylglycerol kinase theta-like n=1 Tax=Dysidea avara TaxID=196820 RepID=UPI0033198CDB
MMEPMTSQKKRHSGHDFKRRNFFQPTYCEHCSDLLWGIKGQGFTCRVCRFTCHEKCMNTLVTMCPHLALTAITEPLAHKWGKAVTTKRRFCNVCRKKADSSTLFCCLVCNYYAHKQCKLYALVNCKATSLYSIEAVRQHKHHWIEGNLPKGKCEECGKSYGDQCLNGMRCTWCGILVHSSCFIKIEKTPCDFRDLSALVLAPEIVEWYGSDLGAVSAIDQVSDSPIYELEDDEEDTEEKGYQVMVFEDMKDCYQQQRRSSSQRLLVSKKMTAKEVLDLALKKFQIPEDNEEDYYLLESIDETTQRPLLNTDIPFNISESTGRIPNLVIKFKDHGIDEKAKIPLTIYSQWLHTKIKHVKLGISKSSTVATVIEEALILFDMEDEVADNFLLDQVYLHSGVQTTSLAPSHCIWDTITFLKTQPVRKHTLTRFYLRKKTSNRFVLAVWGLPKEQVKDLTMAQKFIEKLLPGNVLEDAKFGPFYPNAKLVFIDCTTLFAAGQICNILDQTSVKLHHYILPNLHPECLEKHVVERQEPLLVFINGRSGGNQGLDLLTKFRHYLNPHQVFDIGNGGPHVGLHAFRNIPRFRILIGGGDGTFGWVLSVLEEAQDALCFKEPLSALLPLGTGNDLARVLHWGPGYSGEKVLNILFSVENADVAQLDRWMINFIPDQLPTINLLRKDSDLALKYGYNALSTLDTKDRLVEEKQKMVVMNNYFGIGLDADIALDFHLAREENPEKFSSRFHNKGVYVQLALQKMVTKKVTAELSKHINIIVDDHPVQLPDLEGIVVLNIQSWGAGAEVWGNPSEKKLKNAHFGDGVFEVVGIGGVMHMGQMQGGLRGGTRLAQGSKCKIKINHAVSVQVDGEPWTQRPCTVTIEQCAKQAQMLKKSGRKISSVNRQQSSSSKQNAIRPELQRHHTDGDLTGLQRRKYPENKRPGSPQMPM